MNQNLKNVKKRFYIYAFTERCYNTRHCRTFRWKQAVVGPVCKAQRLLEQRATNCFTARDYDNVPTRTTPSLSSDFSNICAHRGSVGWWKAHDTPFRSSLELSNRPQADVCRLSTTLVAKLQQAHSVYTQISPVSVYIQVTHLRYRTL